MSAHVRQIHSRHIRFNAGIGNRKLASPLLSLLLAPTGPVLLGDPSMSGRDRNVVKVLRRMNLIWDGHYGLHTQWLFSTLAMMKLNFALMTIKTMDLACLCTRYSALGVHTQLRCSGVLQCFLASPAVYLSSTIMTSSSPISGSKMDLILVTQVGGKDLQLYKFPAQRIVTEQSGSNLVSRIKSLLPMPVAVGHYSAQFQAVKKPTRSPPLFIIGNYLFLLAKMV
ncbi:hypothetical protein JOM56_011038 [Amanita muscaria]